MREAHNDHRGDDGGTATAELAMGLPALFAVVVVAVGLIWTVSLQARCGDAARIGARVAARGDNDATAVQWASRAAPPGAQVTVTRDDGFVHVKVSCPVGVDGRWPVGDVEAVAVTVTEVALASPVSLASLASSESPGSGLASRQLSA